MNKILIIAPSRKLGGIERKLFVLANESANRDIQVTYVSCLKHDPFYVLDAKIQIIEPGFKKNSSIINRFTFYPHVVFFNEGKFNPYGSMVEGSR